MEPRGAIEAFKHFELEGWQQSVDAYDRWFGPLTAQMIEPLLAALAPNRSERLLDVASGPGDLAARAADRGCKVVAIDMAEAMVARARQRQKSADIDFRVGDAERLGFAAGEFDIVAMNFGMLHLAQPEKAAAEAHRVLKPGGRFGFTVWSSAEQSAAFAVVLKAIEAHGSPNVELPAGPPFFKYSDREAGVGLLAAAGFTQITAQLVSLRWRLPTAESLFEAFYHGTARTGGNLRAQPFGHRERIRQAVVAAAAAFARDGALDLPMAAWVYAGVKPA